MLAQLKNVSKNSRTFYCNKLQKCVENTKPRAKKNSNKKLKFVARGSTIYKHWEIQFLNWSILIF